MAISRGPHIPLLNSLSGNRIRNWPGKRRYGAAQGQASRPALWNVVGLFLIVENLVFVGFVFYVYDVCTCRTWVPEVPRLREVFPDMVDWPSQQNKSANEERQHLRRQKDSRAANFLHPELSIKYAKSKESSRASYEGVVFKADDASQGGHVTKHAGTTLSTVINRTRGSRGRRKYMRPQSRRSNGGLGGWKTSADLQLRSFTIMVSANSGFADFTQNWLTSLREIGVTYNVTILVEDAEAFGSFQRLQAVYPGSLKILLQSGVNGSHVSDAVDHHSVTYYKLINRRPASLLRLLKTGVDVLLADIDAFWIKDPMAVIAPELDQYDAWIAPGHFPNVPCPCFMYFKSGAMSVKFVQAWVEWLNHTTKAYKDDQEALASVIKSPLGREMRLKWLDLEQFPDGDTYRSRKMSGAPLGDVFIFHANRVLGHDVKKSLMKRHGFWRLQEALRQ